jgi:predicted DNA-binding transcriptional regulator YafY
MSWRSSRSPRTGCNDFRSFRVDRIERLEVQDDRFRDEPGQTLADLFRRESASANYKETTP